MISSSLSSEITVAPEALCSILSIDFHIFFGVVFAFGDKALVMSLLKDAWHLLPCCAESYTWAIISDISKLVFLILSEVSHEAYSLQTFLLRRA